jgi:glycerol-3-phosphate O-acyltransferase/dihydroxyacetone phosphate acyltransferase
MELKLVYRALRKVSDWTLSDYYSEVSIQGKENVPKGGPLIMYVSDIEYNLALANDHYCLALLPTTMKSLTLLRWVSSIGNRTVWIDPTSILAAMIPYRRHLSFWAKSTMFANPVAGAVLSSTGAIPVRRNPNSNSTAMLQSSTSGPSTSKMSSSSSTNDSSSRAALFRETSRALSDEQVVGVFPEGTSYTRESIAQIMPGAAWAAVEYARYLHDRVGKSTDPMAKGKGKGKEKETDPGLHTGLKIIPVAIVYTDKSRYQSRVSATWPHYSVLISCIQKISIKYGTPIMLDDYVTELFDGNVEETSKTVVKKIMGQVEAQLIESTINASDWSVSWILSSSFLQLPFRDTICAVSVARCILWEDENKVPLEDWVDISQRSVNWRTKSE